MKPSRKAREEAGGRNQDGFTLPARSCYVIGVDTEHGPEHPLYKAHAADVVAGRRPYDERMLRSMAADGVLEAVRVQLHTVDVGDKLWPADTRGKTIHQVLLGGNRIIHFRKVLETAPVGSEDGWQVRCVLDTGKDHRRSVSVQIAENVCRRRMDDEEMAHVIASGLNVGLTLDELADQLGVSKAKAKRLKNCAEGEPPHGIKPRVRIAAAIWRGVTERLGDSTEAWPSADVASLLAVARGKLALRAASRRVRDLFTEDHNDDA